MREVSDLAAKALTGSHTVSSSVAVYYGGVPVLDDVPVSGGVLEYDAAQEVPGSLSLTFPRFIITEDEEQVDLMPTDSASPLACDGAQLAVTYYLGLPGGGREAVGLGWYRIESWYDVVGGVEVSAESLEAVVQEWRFLSPKVIAKNTLRTDVATSLVAGLLPLEVTADALKQINAQTFEENRLAALRKVVLGWPARMVVDDSGTLLITPPHNDATDPIVGSLTDGEGGTVVHVPTSGTRAGVYNAVKASGEASTDVAPVSAVVYQTEGPRAWNSPYGNVPYFFSSPLITTVDEARAAAKTRLRELRAAAEAVTITCAPDPRFEHGDLIEVTFAGRTRVVRIQKLSLPLTASGGAMTIVGIEVDR